MRSIAEISVDDEVAIGFCYQAGKSISIDFEGYYSIVERKYVDNNCSLIIKQWTGASAELYGTGKRQELDSALGIIAMVLGLKEEFNNLEAWVSTVDGRYLLLRFENAQVGYDSLLSSN